MTQIEIQKKLLEIIPKAGEIWKFDATPDRQIDAIGYYLILNQLTGLIAGQIDFDVIDLLTGEPDVVYYRPNLSYWSKVG